MEKIGKGGERGRGGKGVPGAICARPTAALVLLVPFLMPGIEKRERFFCSAKFFEKVKMIWRWQDPRGKEGRECVSVL